MRYILTIIILTIPLFTEPETISPLKLTDQHLNTGYPPPDHIPCQIDDVLFYDDGNAVNAAAWYQNGAGWGYYFDAGNSCNIEQTLVYFHPFWPSPGGSSYGIKITEDDNGSPGIEVYSTSGIPGSMGCWNIHNLPGPIYDADGKFFLFYIQEGAYPNCLGLSDDYAQEDTFPDWYYLNGEYGRGFPRNDFLLRAEVEKVGIGERSNQNIWTVIFPTITRGIFTLKFNLNRSQNVNVYVFNLNGSVVAKVDNNIQAGKTTLPLNLSHLPNGIYYLQVETGDDIKTSRLIIIH